MWRICQSGLADGQSVVTKWARDVQRHGSWKFQLKRVMEGHRMWGELYNSHVSRKIRRKPIIYLFFSFARMVSGELNEAFSMLSPGTLLVGFIAILFLFTQAWPRLSRQIQAQESSALTPANSEHSSQLSVSKEPEVPEGWWSGRDAFELERRAIFSKVINYGP